jgi:hypothetical protein
MRRKADVGPTLGSREVMDPYSANSNGMIHALLSLTKAQRIFGASSGRGSWGITLGRSRTLAQYSTSFL